MKMDLEESNLLLKNDLFLAKEIFDLKDVGVSLRNNREYRTIFWSKRGTSKSPIVLTVDNSNRIIEMDIELFGNIQPDDTMGLSLALTIFLRHKLRYLSFEGSSWTYGTHYKNYPEYRLFESGDLYKFDIKH